MCRRVSGLRAFVAGSSLFVVACLAAVPASAFQREIQAAADAVGEKLAASAKRSVAVVDFTDLQGEVTELGRFLAEEMSVALASASRPLEVVDRTHLKVLIQEHKLSATGLIDPATAKKLGQIAGADALVTGTLTPFGDSVRLTLKVLDASTARIVAASTAEIPKTTAIEELVARGVGAPAPPAQPAGPRLAGSSSGMPAPIESKGLRFTLKRCGYSGGGIRCELLVENLAEGAMQLTFYGNLEGWIPPRRYSSSSSSSSYLYDIEGNQYRGNTVVLGANSGEGHVEQSVIPGIPLAARITFSEVPGGLVQGSLSLSFQVEREVLTVAFRNVAIVK